MAAFFPSREWCCLIITALLEACAHPDQKLRDACNRADLTFRGAAQSHSAALAHRPGGRGSSSYLGHRAKLGKEGIEGSPGSFWNPALNIKSRTRTQNPELG